MLNRTLTPHSMINGNACFAYFNKIWGIPNTNRAANIAHARQLLAVPSRPKQPDTPNAAINQPRVFRVHVRAAAAA